MTQWHWEALEEKAIKTLPNVSIAKKKKMDLTPLGLELESNSKCQGYFQMALIAINEGTSTEIQ